MKDASHTGFHIKRDCEGSEPGNQDRQSPYLIDLQLARMPGY